MVEPIRFDFATGALPGTGIQEVACTLGQLEGLFRDAGALRFN